jgi:peroxiredoxin
MNYYKPKVDDKQGENSFLNEFNFINNFFKNQLIKEYFWFNKVYDYVAFNEDKYLKENYELYEKKAFNPSFKEKIESLYKETFKSSKGVIVPDFEYEDQNGKKVKLSDFREKYVFIEFLTHWCPYCKAQVPHFKKLKVKYKDKPIEFITISLDKQKDKNKWKEFLKKENLNGIELIADKSFNYNFAKFFQIIGIPTFVLLNKEGKVLKRRALWPSNENEIKELLDTLE